MFDLEESFSSCQQRRAYHFTAILQTSWNVPATQFILPGSREHSITIRGGLPEGLVCMTSRGDVPESPARCVQRGRRGKGTTHSLMPSLLLQAKAFRWKPDDPFPIPRHAMLSFLFPAQMPTGASSQMF
eukprot:scaffold127483_cov17-Tisochrysis_lutea.AAC.4